MTDTVQHTVTKILASVEEGSAAHNYVSIITGIIERNNLAAAHAELRGYGRYENLERLHPNF